MKSSQVIYCTKWDKHAGGAYLFGSEVSFDPDGSVRFEGPLIPSGTVIREWYSHVNYQAKKFEPQLPILKEGARYEAKLFLAEEPADTILLRFNFYDRQGELISYYMTHRKCSEFVCPEGTYRYTGQLVQAGSDRFRMHHLELRELPGEPEIDDGAETSKVTDGSWLSCGYEIYHPDPESYLRNILIPEIHGSTIRIPGEDELPELTNLVIAPSEALLTGWFYSDEWLERLDVRDMRYVTFLSCGETAGMTAFDLELRYPGSRSVRLMTRKELREYW